MELKLLLTLLVSMSTLQAGSFADITRPTKKACADIACVLASHPGALALTTGVAGVLMYSHADRKLKNMNQKIEILEDYKKRIFKHTEEHYLIVESEYQNYSHTLQEAIREYGAVRNTLLHRKREIETLKHIQTNYETRIDLSDLEIKELNQLQQQIKDKQAQLDADLKRVAALEPIVHVSFNQEVQTFKEQAFQAHYNRLWYCGVFLALTSALSYSLYKAYPKLQKWYAAYVKPQ